MRSPLKLTRREWVLIGLVLLGAFLWWYIATAKISWKEDVRLSNDEVIVVQRTAKAKALGEIGGSGGWENEGMTLKVIKPIKADNPPEWNFPFVPIIFDRDAKTKVWFVVATFYTCVSWYDLKRPKLPYVEYHLVEGKWTQRPLSPELIGRPANMLTSIRSSGEPDHTLGSKGAIMGDPAIAASYRKIVSQWSTGC